ncbi:hypothetical protein ACRAWF_35280 [Streptomyces sp. L7]
MTFARLFLLPGVAALRRRPGPEHLRRADRDHRAGSPRATPRRA